LFLERNPNHAKKLLLAGTNLDFEIKKGKKMKLNFGDSP